METTKLSTEELEKLQEIQQKNAAVVTEFGNLEIPSYKWKLVKPKLSNSSMN